MRPLLLLLAGAAAAFPQAVSFGVKGGVPLTDFFSAVQQQNFNFNTAPNRYIIGPTLEIGLLAGFRFEVDALYRHLNYSSQAQLVDALQSTQTTANAWEFPLLLKWRMPTPIIKPYLDGGVAFDTLNGVKQTVVSTVRAVTGTTGTSSPAELKNSHSVGLVLGAGVDIHAIFVHISPEIRYTRWTNQHFNLNNILTTNQNQAEFLVGITF